MAVYFKFWTQWFIAIIASNEKNEFYCVDLAS